MSEVLNTVNEVDITSEMVTLYAQRFAEEVTEDSKPGIILSISDWINGRGTLDSYLTDSPETRDVFAPVRRAYLTVNGKNPDEAAFSNVTFAEGVAKGLESKRVEKEAREAHEAETASAEAPKPEAPAAE